MILTDVAVRNRTTVAVLVVLIIVLGVQSYVTLPRELAPDIPIPIVLVSTAYEGVSPGDIESSVTIKIEKEMAGLKGLKEMRSTSSEGMSVIMLEFLPDMVIEDALQYVRDRLDLAKPDLPTDAEEPSVKEINISEFPILIVSISGELSPLRLKAIADDLEDTTEQLPGVLSVDVVGVREREIRLEIDPDRLASYNLTLPEVLALIPSENVNISAGGLETKGTKFNVRVPAEFVQPSEVDHLLLSVRGGMPIYLSDVATLRDTFKDRDTYSRLNGMNSITLNVKKRVGANIIEVAEAVKLILAEARKQAPAGVEFDVISDMSREIRLMVKNLENNILTALVLVVAVLLIFLGWRTSLIVALVIPLSMLISFAVIQMVGYTLNMVILFSLILALGMLVDNAIVIVENIHRHGQMGYSRRQAAIKGAAEVAWPVTTSTATTIAAFAPMAFWPGIMGEFMSYLPITVIIVLGSSLFVALVISPTVSSVFARAMKRTRKEAWAVRGYRWFLKHALAHRVTTLVLAVSLLAALVLLYDLMGIGVELFPTIDPKRAMIDIRSPQGTNIHESNRLACDVERIAEPYRQEFDHLVTNVGSAGGGVAAFLSGGGGGAPHNANLTLVFKDFELRNRPSADVIAHIRGDLADMAGAEINVEKEKEGPPTGAPVTVRIIGKDFKQLEEISKRARDLIADVPGLVNLRSDLEATRPEFSFRPDRREAAMARVNTAVIGNFLKLALFGREVGKYREFKDEYDITVRLPESQRTDIDDLFRLRIPNAAGQCVPLSSLGDFEYKGGFGTINHVNQQRVVTLTADAEGRLGTEVLADVQQRLKKLDMPQGYAIGYAGEQEEREKAEAFLTKAFVIAMLLIVLILVAQFNSLTVPFVIMSAVILSLVGVLAGLVICKMPFGIIMTGIGVIGLAGVVVNNAIVLLHYTRQLQRRGMELVEAAIEAGRTRLRPVLLTAATTILALIPMATGVSFDFHKMEWMTRSESSQWWRSMAIAVIFGLAFATILTLVVAPTLYVSLYRLAAWFGLGGVRKTDEDPGPEPADVASSEG